jgi:SAM-dependent methyltransferase
VKRPLDIQPARLPTEEDVASFQRDYPGRPGALQLDAGRFRAGMAILPLFVELGGLRPSDDVLDVGCGAGRMAYALTGHLDSGTYEGFDTIEGLIRWAQGSISAAFPSFRFRHVPLANSAYFPDGTIAPDRFTFPYPDESFDFAIVSSVFTHMRGREVRHYLDELARVLRPGGRVFATWFLLDHETDAAIHEGRALFSIVHPVEDGYTHEPENPELAIGFRRDDVLRWTEAAALVTVGVHEGNWRGRPSRIPGQDVIIAKKP